MASRRLKTSLSRLDVTRKWILISSVILALSAILPWYEDLDAFGAGDLYLGITGPLFLVGLMVLASAVFIGSWILLPLRGKRLPDIPVKEGALYTFLGIQNLLLLLVANSVFFHPKFGKTFAELSMAEKNSVSHRGQALAEVSAEIDKIVKWLKQRLGEEKAPKPDHEQFMHNDWSEEVMVKDVK